MAASKEYLNSSENILEVQKRPGTSAWEAFPWKDGLKTSGWKV